MRQEKNLHDTTLRSALCGTLASVRARPIGLGTQLPRLALLMLAFTLGACDLGGSGGGGAAPVASGTTTVPPVGAATVIDLPAGQQIATLAWAPSAGSVANYLVYESRNDGDYEFAGVAATNRTTVNGEGGDAIRVAVLAVNSAGTSSQASVPSPEIRFHDAAAAVAAGPPMPAPPTPVAIAPNESTTQTVAAAESADGRGDGVTPENMDATDTTDTSDSKSSGKISDSLRSMLLAGDARLPASGLGTSADVWLQERVEDEFNAGVRLVGTGERDQDGLRELVWQDSAGQLFVSDGQAVENLERTEDVPTTFEQAIRLGATERYVALADFDGDAVGDWIVEDVNTGSVWIINGITLESTDARGPSETDSMTLVGTGDFDGDNRQEFVWQAADGQLSLGHPTGQVASISGAAGLAIEAGGRMLTVADVDGNDRDDLITVDAAGQLQVALVLLDATSDLYFDVHAGANQPTQAGDGLDFVATVDHDEDGRSEIVWLNDGELDVWDAENGPEAF